MRHGYSGKNFVTALLVVAHHSIAADGRVNAEVSQGKPAGHQDTSCLPDRLCID